MHLRYTDSYLVYCIYNIQGSQSCCGRVTILTSINYSSHSLIIDYFVASQFEIEMHHYISEIHSSVFSQLTSLTTK